MQDKLAALKEEQLANEAKQQLLDQRENKAKVL